MVQSGCQIFQMTFAINSVLLLTRAQTVNEDDNLHFSRFHLGFPGLQCQLTFPLLLSSAFIAFPRSVGVGGVPRRYVPAVHGTEPNDFLQFAHIEFTPADSGDKYILMLRDDPSVYCWMFGCADNTAENAARAIIDWAAAFGVPKNLMPDGSTHLRNWTLRLVCKGLHVPQHFPLPYRP